MLRTFVVALFFAGITVCSYYFLNSYPLPWLDDVAEKVAGESGLPSSEKEIPPMEPFSNAPPEMAMNPDTSDESLPPLPSLPTLELPENLRTPENQTAALPAPQEMTEKNPFETAPVATVAEPEHRVGNPLPDLSPSVPSVDLPVSEEMPIATYGTENVPTLPSTIPAATPSASGTAFSGEMSNPLRSGGNDLSPLVRGTVPETPSAGLPASGDVYTSASTLPTTIPEMAPASHSAAPVEDRAVHEYLMQASSKIQNGEALEVLRSLSPYYGDPRFSPKELDYLVSILVQAATQVVYSQKSFLEPPYEVQNGDTLEGIAQKYQIPVEFLARVNGIQTPYTLTPGQRLKVLRGPFNAIVYLDRYELILTLNGLFAGRFWIGVGGDLLSKDGDFYFRQVLRQNNPQQGFAFEFVKNRAQTTPGQPLADSLILHPAADAGVMGKNVAHGNILLSQTDMSSLQALLGKDSQLILRSQSPHAQAERARSAAGMAESPLPAVNNPIASPLEASIGTQASLPGYETPPISENAGGIPTTGDLPVSLPGDLPTELPNY
ncbi:MAG: LysM peptidoglycan-binding domain-containing protein [Planctomycetia bacterium]|nr:LysM peptidoglycan-binding domain-containing protein [Planctomycetia bacterium]